MDGFFENGLARMYGPYFLFFYILLIIAGIIFVKFLLPRTIGRKKENAFELPRQPDPYAVASLRGGKQQLILLIIYNLMKRGYFVFLVNEKRTVVTVKRKIHDTDKSFFTPMEFIVYDSLSDEWALNAYVNYIERSLKFKVVYEDLQKSLEKENYLLSEKEYQHYEWGRWATIILIDLIGLYKLIAAQLHGHSNVFYLIILAVIATTVIAKIKITDTRTKKGDDFLKQMSIVFKEQSGDKLQAQPLYMQQLLIGIYGFALLRVSNFDFLNTYQSKLLDSPGETGSIVSMLSGFSSNSCGGASGCGGGGGCGGGCGGCS